MSSLDGINSPHRMGTQQEEQAAQVLPLQNENPLPFGAHDLEKNSRSSLVTQSRTNSFVPPTLLGAMLLALVLFIIINSFVFWKVNSELTKSVKAELETRSRVISGSVSQFFIGKLHTVLLLDQYQPIRDLLSQCNTGKEVPKNPNYANVVSMLKSVNIMYKGMDKFYSGVENYSGSDEVMWLASVKGDYLLSQTIVMDPDSVDDQGKPDPWVTKKRPWYPYISTTQGIAFTDTYIDAQFRVPCVSVVKTFRDETKDKEAEPIGIVGFDVFLPTVNAIMNNAQVGKSGMSILIDGNNIVVYHPKLEFSEKRKLRDLGQGFGTIQDRIDTASRSNEEAAESVLINLDGVATYVSFSKVAIPNANWFVITIVPKTDAEGAVSDYFDKMVLVSIADLALFLFPIVVFFTIEYKKRKDVYEANKQLAFANKQLEIAKEHAESVSRSKSEFLAQMSHEIRTPMNGVIGLSEMLFNTPPLTPIQSEYISVIRQSAGALLTVINDILDLSKIEADKLIIEQYEIDPQSIAEEVCESVALKVHVNAVRLVVLVEPGTCDRYIGDGARIRQVLLNLVSNASKFTDQGEIVIRISERNERLRFEVSDTGLGVSPEKLESIFNPYEQADFDTTRKFGGTGLGLTITRKLVLLMGGDIGAESTLGKGSLFWFELPLNHSEDDRSATIVPGPVKTAIVFDLHVPSRLSLAHILSHWGIRTVEAGSVAELSDYLSGEKPLSDPIDVLFFQSDLREFTPHDLVEFLKKNPKNGSLKFVATYPLGKMPESVHHGLPGMVDALSSPFRRLATRHVVVSGLGIKIDKETPMRQTTISESPVKLLRILLAEDVRINVMVAKAMIESLGHQLDIAENGLIALEKLRTNDYDIVLMDCQMPEMDGYECTKQIRNPETGVRNRNIPVIAMTANAVLGNRDVCLAAGMNDFISKPININQLNETLNRWAEKT